MNIELLLKNKDNLKGYHVVALFYSPKNFAKPIDKIKFTVYNIINN